MGVWGFRVLVFWGFKGLGFWILGFRATPKLNDASYIPESTDIENPKFRLDLNLVMYAIVSCTSQFKGCHKSKLEWLVVSLGADNI